MKINSKHSSMNWQLDHLTISSTFILLLVACHTYWAVYQKKCKQLDLLGFFILSLSISSIVSSCNLIRLTLTSPTLKNILGGDSIVLVLGAGAIIWISSTELAKLFGLGVKKTTRKRSSSNSQATP